MAHTERCFPGIPAKEVHGAATHHVRAGSICMHVCSPCARGYQRRGKEVEVTELTFDECTSEFECPECGSKGWPKSKTGVGCEFCDGTFAGCGP